MRLLKFIYTDKNSYQIIGFGHIMVKRCLCWFDWTWTLLS